MDTNITESFIAMVEAYKAKPELEAQVRQLSEDNALCYQTIELKASVINELDSTIAELRAKLSEVTTQRDDAMFRNLELEEKLGGIERLLGLAERVESARKAEHEATVATMTPKPLVEAAVVTEQGSTIVEPSYTGPIDPVVVEPQPNFDGPAIPDQGQSENRPTVTDSAEVLIEQPTTTSKDGPETQTPSDWDRNDSRQYLNKPWSEKPWWITPGEWYDAGGMMA
jgi:hypothetical protein